jgi:hypothetical protein
VVVRTEPDTFATLDGFEGPVKFHFDERISERVEGVADEAVIVSPSTGELRVKLGRSSITVDAESGFQPGLVYRVTLLPVVRDMFGNQLRDPFELVFSTGGVFSPSAVAGLVWDRVTGESVEGVEVRAVADGRDLAVHVAKTDTGGVYALRYLPPGRYRLVAFEDRNRDGLVDSMEYQGGQVFRLDNPTDTVFQAIPMLQPDTSAARIVDSEVLDSVTVVVDFDDYLDPAVTVEDIGVALAVDSGTVPEVDTLYHEHEYNAFVEMVRDSFVRLDSLDALARAAAGEEGAPRDTATTGGREEAPDTLAPRDPTAAGDSAAVQEVPRRRVPPASLGQPLARSGARRPDGSTAPSRRLVLVLAEGMVPDRPHTLTLTGVTNINGITGGGGEVSLVLASPPDTTSQVPDSAAVEDTLLAPPDTGRAALVPVLAPRPGRRE